MSDYEVQYTVTLFCTTDNGGSGHPSATQISDALSAAVPGWSSDRIDVQDVSAVLEFDGEDA